MITADHLRELLDRGQDDAVLVLLRGRVEVVDSRESDPERGQGAMTVVSRRELIERLDAEGAASGDLGAVAAALDTMVTHQGG
ncbi:hypothetical protein ABZ299_23355 [Streptomyces sp. NPDC006184]|uniref:hypothetical protein n=1 Tax=Streptomyces sp. NPDC006184 TaxID=3155455 RepID=UPI00339ED9CA